MITDTIKRNIEKLCAQTPSAKNWERITALLDALTSRGLENEAVSLFREPLKQWPGHLLEAPGRWKDQIRQTNVVFPRWSLVRNLELGELDEIISQEMLVKIEYLKTSAFSTTYELSSITAATNLKKLDCSNSRNLVSSEMFINLTKLQWLDISFCTNLTEIDHLRFLHELEYLRMDGLSHVEQVKGLTNLKLKTLLIGKSPEIKDFSPVSTLKQLEELSIINKNNSRIQFLGNLSSLRVLNFEGDFVTADLSPLKNLEMLRELRLTGVDLTKNPLPVLPALNDLELVECNTPANWQFLEPFKKLQTLSVSFNSDTEHIMFPKGLNELYALKISYFKNLEDLSTISRLSRLNRLELTFNEQLTGINEIESLIQLKYLSLMGCRKAGDISFVNKLPQLENLIIIGCDEIKNDHLVNNVVITK